MPARTPQLRSFAAVALACAALCVPARAAAWTRTEVRAMRAHAEVSATGNARITLELRVEVLGGWIERFELAGLSPSSAGLRVDAGKPPTFVSESADPSVPPSKHAPEAKLRDDGTLLLLFGERATAPHRGSYRGILTYETQLASSTTHPGAYTLSLPAWPAALENVELWIDAPAGARLLESEGNVPEERQLLERGALTVLHLTRAQLPRTEPMEAHLMLPRPRTESAQSAVPAATRAPSTRDTHSSLWAGLALGLLLAFKLVAAGPRRAAEQVPMPPDSAFRRIVRIDMERAERAVRARLWGPASWLDITTPSGGLLFAVLLTCTIALAATAGSSERAQIRIAAFGLAAPLWLVRTRKTRLPDAHDALLALLRGRESLASAARALDARATLEVAREAPCSPITFARIRVATADQSHALVLVLAHDRAGRATLAWLDEPSAGSVRLIATADPARELAQLLSLLRVPDAASRSLAA